ncbi:ComEC family competence protein [Vitreoscilla sp. C1]|uniref:DNA internalization-related competence protein ComEC/Rec2 n=1 Tax=Vitreoscilla sp. (strain C1) TaxID=96942 RepID=UPI000CDC5A7D|nr:DNA internalization-related competence protein ComEC/Rec2 [Vitreoscilla sp. C1]AUZ04558.1 ComEC family competence protein [Vitreoscilla sp. C1]
MAWVAWCLGVMLCVFLPTLPWLWLLLAAGLLGCAAHKWGKWHAWLFLCLGFVYAFFRLQWALEQQVPIQNAIVPQTAQVTVLDVATEQTYGQRFLAQIILQDGQTFQVYAYDAHQQIWKVGQISQCNVRLRPNIGAVNAAGFHVEAWALANGMDGSAHIGKHCQISSLQNTWQFWHLWRENVWQRLQNFNTPNHQGKAMVAALTVGVQDGLSSSTWQAMRQLGVVHLVSISGVHVTMLAVLVGWLVGTLLRYLPYTVKTPMLWQCWAGVAVAFLYALVAGFQVPTQRTVWMLLVFAIALTGKWRLSLGQVWWRALAVVVGLQPAAFLSIGLWLSFGLVAIMMWAAHAWRERGNTWRVLLRVQTGLMLLTVVLVGAYFHIVPVLSPLFNAIAIPWFSWVLTPWALVAVLLPWDAPLLGVVAVAQYSVDVSVWAVAYSPEYVIAAQSTWMLILALLAAFLCLLPQAALMRPVTVLIMVLWMVYRPPVLEQGQLRLQVLDVGQGLSVLLNTQNHRLLFDTGRSSAQTAIIPALYAQGWRDLDVLVLSHHDDDHDGAAAELLQTIAAHNIWVSDTQAYPQWRTHTCREHAWQWDGVWFEWLTLPLQNVKNTTNARSCVLRVVTQGQAVLIPADIGHAEEAGLLQRYGHNLRSTVLILGHHGSSGSSSGAWLNVVDPDIAIASSGWNNAYHHPTPAVQNRLSAHEIELYRTDMQGGAVWILDEQLHFKAFTGRRFWWQRKPFTAQSNASETSNDIIHQTFLREHADIGRR